MKAAIVAHYDPDNVWDENFLMMLGVLGEVVDQIILVTTSTTIPDIPSEFTNVMLIRRPNIGYDFYSYRVGVNKICENASYDGVFILNSSLILLHAEKFKTLLKTIADNNGNSAIRGVTASNQIRWHLQSYLLYFNLRKLPINWLGSFFSKVQPVNTKFEVVLAYEIGLSKQASLDNISVDAVFSPKLSVLLRGMQLWMRRVAALSGRFGWLTARPWSVMHEVNWVHFGAEALAKEYGFVKAEVIRSNPHGLPLDGIFLGCENKILQHVKHSVLRTKKHYEGAGNGLTELAKSNDLGEFRYQLIESRMARKTGAKIAVVLHLYYFHLLDEILGYVDNILEPVDLFITTPFEADVAKIINNIGARGQSVSIFLGENRGRDVGPFVALFRSGILNSYDAVLKIHSKVSLYSDNGPAWRKQLYDPLCGSSIVVLRTLELLRLGGIGIVGPERFFLSNRKFWGANRNKLSEILESAGINVSEDGPELGFFAGTMFWFSPKALMAIQRIPSHSVAFEPENGKQDGTLAHAWERAFCLLAIAEGYRVTSVNIGGSDIFNLDNESNKVPVLD